MNIHEGISSISLNSDDLNDHSLFSSFLTLPSLLSQLIIKDDFIDIFKSLTPIMKRKFLLASLCLKPELILHYQLKLFKILSISQKDLIHEDWDQFIICFIKNHFKKIKYGNFIHLDKNNIGIDQRKKNLHHQLDLSNDNNEKLNDFFVQPQLCLDSLREYDNSNNDNSKSYSNKFNLNSNSQPPNIFESYNQSLPTDFVPSSKLKKFLKDRDQMFTDFWNSEKNDRDGAKLNIMSSSHSNEPVEKHSTNSLCLPFLKPRNHKTYTKSNLPSQIDIESNICHSLFSRKIDAEREALDMERQIRRAGMEERRKLKEKGMEERKLEREQRNIRRMEAWESKLKRQRELILKKRLEQRKESLEIIRNNAFLVNGGMIHPVRNKENKIPIENMSTLSKHKEAHSHLKEKATHENVLVSKKNHADRIYVDLSSSASEKISCIMSPSQKSSDKLQLKAAESESQVDEKSDILLPTMSTDISVSYLLANCNAITEPKRFVISRFLDGHDVDVNMNVQDADLFLLTDTDDVLNIIIDEKEVFIDNKRTIELTLFEMNRVTKNWRKLNKRITLPEEIL